ncbi:Multidrug resistance protein MdtB [Stieleria maiorica]|uniref:Multidrug resistance protein MdtB n=1 Tax=Stieleria maiorica TaxID=2795974 RepID=A0A5B9MG93_9BACT|nr:efflux RND transporter permease subunit [Stieleria maiorica]QEF99873.1 Multidrug resistance protein MdtB [Stieleria maiorica]
MMKAIVNTSIHNRAALNLCMVAIMIVGWFCLRAMHRESFPEFDLDRITVTVPYPGAAPQEAEQGIGQKVEEAVRSIEGIKKVTTVAMEGSCTVLMELIPGARSPDRVLDEVRSGVDRIPSFPLEAEDPVVTLVTNRRPSIRVGVLAPETAPRNADDTLSSQAQLDLREVAERIRDDLLAIDSVSQVDFLAARDYQIDIEIPEETLRAHGLTLRQAAEIIRRENRELPAGSIRSQSQEVLLRGNNRRTNGDELAELPLVTEPSGAVLTVADLGTVRDEFTDATAINVINGKPALALSVERSTSEDLFVMIDAVKDYVANAELPPGYQLMTWSDESVEVRGRLDLLLNNGAQGLVIVFTLLLLFLDPKLAFWVALGIPFSILAAGIFLYLTGQTLNLISMFAFVMALGIVVDDAIVVGENVFAHRQMGKPHLRAAIDGTVEVIPSVTTAVLTTVVAFAPLLFVSGTMGKFTAVMPAAIIAILMVSLFECITILPCHLAHEDSIVFRFFNVVLYVFRPLLLVAQKLNRGATWLLDRYIDRVYGPTLRWSLGNRSIAVALCFAALILTGGLYRSGIIQFNFFPRVDGNTLSATVVFPDGTPESVTVAATKQVEDAFWRIADRYDKRGQPIAKTSYRVVGAAVSGGGPGGSPMPSGGGGHKGSVEVELVNAESRGVHSRAIVAQWREEVGTIVGTEELTLGTRSFGPGGTPIEFKLLGPARSVDKLETAVEECKERLAKYPGVYDIKDDSVPGKWEYRFRIKPEAFAMGVRTADLAETVRAAYYGEEVMRVQRGRHEVKIMVTYPRDDRRLLANFDEVRVRLSDGIERPITELAEIDVVRAYSEINRIDQARSITVSSNLDEETGNAEEIVADLQAEFLPGLLAKYPELRVRWEGQQERRAESMGSLFSGFGVALFAMYILLAIEFKSSVQPLLVMLIIPFGALGAVVGHLMMGLPLTLFSFYGIIALTGIVVNDSIVLIDFINSRVRGGMPIGQALTESGARRFRPVLLTTITTIGGLVPILLESSIQAQILIPMATSIAFGELFATVVVLYLVPVTYSLYWSAGGRLVAESEDEIGEYQSDEPAVPVPA